MSSSSLSGHRQPQPWTGRFDGPGSEHARVWQSITPSTLNPDPGTQDPDSPRPSRPDAVVLGFASDAGVARNQGRIGAAAGPAAIRAAWGPLAAHAPLNLADAGDVVVEHDQLEAGQARFGSALAAWIDDGVLTLGLGGGHEIAYASYLGVAQSAGARGAARWGVLNLDAHFDLRDEQRPSSGTPFLQMARAEEEAGRALNYAVLGISRPNNTRALFERAERLGVRVLEDHQSSLARATAFVADFLADLDELYLTIDLDVLPAYVAPGVSAPASYGVALEVIDALCRQVAASGKLIHVDVAELNPGYDIDARTARVAARLLHSIVSSRATPLSPAGTQANGPIAD